MESLFPVFAQPDINTRGVGRILNSYTNPRRIVSGLNSCLEFSQPLSCLYGTMETENVFCCLNIAVHRHTQPYIRHCLDFQSWRFSLIVGCNIQPSSSATNQCSIDNRPLVAFFKQPYNPFTTLHNHTQLYIALHSSTQPYIILRNPTQLYIALKQRYIAVQNSTQSHIALHTRTQSYIVLNSPALS